MNRTHQKTSRTASITTNLGILGSIVLVSACAVGPSEPSEPSLESIQSTLLAANCTTTAGNLAINVIDGEVGYVGKVQGCTVEPCVFTNAVDASGNICRINSTTGTIAVTSTTAAAAGKLVIDYSNGLFAQATSSTPTTTVSLYTGSTVMVVPPTGGGNMAIGATGLDTNTLLARGTPRVDVTIAAGTSFVFNGGAGKDIFTGDAAGWGTAPTGWATSANIASAVGAASTLAMTINGGPNDDILAGGAGTNTLLGGAGNDTFLQSATSHAETMQGGDGIDTVDYSARTAPVSVTVGKDAAVATVSLGTTGSGGSGYAVNDILTITGCKVAPATVKVLTLSTTAVATVSLQSPGSGCATGTNLVTTTTGGGTLATINILTLAADDGAAGEQDSVDKYIEIVKGGSGDDILNAYPVTTTDVVLIGNGGNDTITGGSGNDDLCGGAGDDRFYDNAGNDNISGGAGSDTLDYSNATALVTACLNPLDTVTGKPCVTTNGAVGEKDVSNTTTLLKVCPRASLSIDQGGTPTATPVPTTMQGGAMAVDVENITGRPAAINALYCGTLACTLLGGTAADTLAGGAATDLIVGFGGSDVVTTNGGNDVVDLTHATGAASTPSVDCASNAVTILVSAIDTGETESLCSLANHP